VGAELYGETSLEADIEIISLMLETLTVAGIDQMTLDIGHQGIVSALLENSGLDPDMRSRCFEALQYKSAARLRELVMSCIAKSDIAESLCKLADLHGGIEVLDRARELMTAVPGAALTALDSLSEIAQRLSMRFPELDLHFDLAELHGYNYHTGLVFAAYVPGCGQAVANGGRYDDIGRVFGRARPTTGFNTDLKILLDLLGREDEQNSGIFVPLSTEQTQWDEVCRLRRRGERVVYGFTGQEADERCDRRLVKCGEKWLLE